jgi:hypothetical protein
MWDYIAIRYILIRKLKSHVHALKNRADINNQFLNFTGSRQGSIYKCFQLQEIGSVRHICNFATCTQAESINYINNMYNALVSFTWGTQKQRNEAEVEVQKVKPDITNYQCIWVSSTVSSIYWHTTPLRYITWLNTPCPLLEQNPESICLYHKF